MRNRWVILLTLLATLFLLEGIFLRGIIVLTTFFSGFEAGAFGIYYFLTSLQFFSLLIFGTALQAENRRRAYLAMAWFTLGWRSLKLSSD